MLAKRVGGLLWLRLQKFCEWLWQLELLQSAEVKAVRVLLFFFAHGRIFSPRDPSWCQGWHSTLRIAVEPGPSDQVHIDLPQCLDLGGTDALAAVVVSVSKVQECENLLWNWGLGLWGSLRWLRLQRMGEDTAVARPWVDRVQWWLVPREQRAVAACSEGGGSKSWL